MNRDRKPGLVHHPHPLRGVAAGQQVEEEGAGLRVAAQPGGVAGVADQRPERQRMDLQPAVARRAQDAEHQHRLAREVAVGRRRHQLAVGEREARRGQRRVALPPHGGRTQRRALDRRLQHAGHPAHVAHRQEQVLHEALDAVLPAARHIAHAGADHRLQVEGQPLLGAAGDVVEVEAHGPEEVPGAADARRLLLREQAAARAVRPHQVGHPLRVEGVAGEPVERLEVAQPAATLLHMRLHHIGAFAVARVARGALRPLGGEKRAEAALLPGAVEGRPEAVEHRAIAHQEARIHERREHASCRAPLPLTQSRMLRVAWPTFSPRSQSR